MGPVLDIFFNSSYRTVPTWQDTTLHVADKFPEDGSDPWTADNFCWISDTQKLGGCTSSDDLRPFCVDVHEVLHLVGHLQTSAARHNIFITHYIRLSAMCNRLIDHRLLVEVAAFLAIQYDGFVEFDPLLLPADAPGVTRVSYERYPSGADTAHLATSETCKWWLRHPNFNIF